MSNPHLDIVGNSLILAAGEVRKLNEDIGRIDMRYAQLAERISSLEEKPLYTKKFDVEVENRIRLLENGRSTKQVTYDSITMLAARVATLEDGQSLIDLKTISYLNSRISLVEKRINELTEGRPIEEFMPEEENKDIEQIIKEDDAPKRFPLVPWLEARGWIFSPGDASAVGRTLGTICREELGDDPSRFEVVTPTCHHAHTYPVKALEEWISRHGKIYPRSNPE